MLTLLVATTACDKEGEAAPANGKGAAVPNAKGGGASKSGPGGPSGGARPPTVLGASDVIVVKTGSIEAAIVISGDLKPIEEIAMRARMEGDIVRVLVREGDRVRRGQLMAEFESTVQEGDRASANAEREAAKSDVANAQWNVDQSAELFKAGAIPERDLRTAQQTLAASSARLAATEARLRAVTQTMEDTRIVAPTTGMVSTRSAETGERVSRGATLFTVVRNDVLELEAAVPARQAGELRAGQLVRFSAGGRQLEGRVARISPTINAANRSITVYLQVPNAKGDLKGNTFATGRVVTRAIENTIVIPVAAVRQSVNGNLPFVYRIVDDKVDVATIEPGVTDDQAGTQQVLSGLEAGDRIIVGNIGALGRGMSVVVVAAEPGGGRGARDMGGTGSAVRPGGTGRRPVADSATKR